MTTGRVINLEIGADEYLFNNKVAAEVARRAALTVCDRADGPADALALLRMLGLAPTPDCDHAPPVGGDCAECRAEAAEPDGPAAHAAPPPHVEPGPLTLCRVCERPIVPHRHGEKPPDGTVFHRARGLCTSCYRAATETRTLHRHPPLNRPIASPWAQANRAGFVAEVVALSDTHPAHVAARFGVAPGTIAKRLYRYGRNDLARRFDVEAKRQRRLREAK